MRRAVLIAGVALVVVRVPEPTVRAIAVHFLVRRPVLQHQLPRAAAAQGSAVIRGRVVAADTGAALRRCRVTCTTSGTGVQRRIAVTDGNGRFEFGNLPANRYFVSVERTGYAGATFGAKPGHPRPGPIDLVKDEVFAQADFRLMKGGIITGRITDDRGDPVVDVMVTTGRRSSRGFTPLTSGYTDDQGVYRLWGLPAGSFYVLSRPERADIMTADGDAISSVAFYPGVPSLAQAGAVTVRVGEEVAAIDFQVVPSRLARVTGMALDSTGQPASAARGAIVSLNEATGSRTTVESFVVARSGAFDIVRLPPGVYQAWVMAARGHALNELGTGEFTTHGEDLTLSITTTQASKVVGVLQSETGTFPRGDGALRVTAVAVDSGTIDPSLMTTPGETRLGTVRANGEFELPVFPGRTVLQVIGLPAGWQVRSILVGGRDVTGTPILVAHGADVTKVQVVVSNQFADVSGHVVDHSGQPAQAAYVVLLPKERNQWMPGGVPGYSDRANQRGRFRITNLVPGEYLLIALDEPDDPDRLTDHGYLDQLRRDAVPVVVPTTTGAPLTLTIKR